MAIFSVFVMAFTTVGYCGASHRKSFLLIIYGCSMLAITIGGIIFWIVSSEASELTVNGRVVFCIIVMLLFMSASFYLAVANTATGSIINWERLWQKLPKPKTKSPSNATKVLAIANPCPVPGCTAACPVPECTYGKILQIV